MTTTDDPTSFLDVSSTDAMTEMAMPRTQSSVGPKVTVVIPVFNSAGTLERCVRSAMRQTERDIEILIADDASTDGGAAIAQSLCDEDARVHLIRIDTNGGKSHAMNVMIAHAKGAWIAVLDADDYFLPTRLARMLATAGSTRVDLVADNLLYLDAGVGEVLRTGFTSFPTSRPLTLESLMRHNDNWANFDYGLLKPVIRRSFIENHNLLYYENTRLSEDFYYLLNFLVAGGRGCLIGEALYCWTMPFGTRSRTWTTTGSGAWRYNYRDALAANTHFITAMQTQNRQDVVTMLQRRGRQYQVMIHYLDAQRLASEGHGMAAVFRIIRRPSTYALLCRRVAGRVGRWLVARAAFVTQRRAAAR